MYHKILVALDATPSDETLLPHIAQLARQCGAELLLFHVADGFAAQHYHGLNLAESEEMREDRDYLAAAAKGIAGDGLTVRTRLAMGSPPEQILKIVIEEKCDLIAMTTHGHKLIGDLLHGSTIERVRHNTDVPLLIVRAKK